MKGIKTPTVKSLTENGKQVVSFAAGAMLSRGAVKAIPGQNSKIAKGAVALATIIAAAAYNGPGKKMVQPALLGMASFQTVELVSEVAATSINRNPQAGVIEKFGYDTLGLAGSCGCHAQPMLNSPAIQAVQWDSVYTPPAISQGTGEWTGV